MKKKPRGVTILRKFQPKKKRSPVHCANQKLGQKGQLIYKDATASAAAAARASAARLAMSQAWPLESQKAAVSTSRLALGPQLQRLLPLHHGEGSGSASASAMASAARFTCWRVWSSLLAYSSA